MTPAPCNRRELLKQLPDDAVPFDLLLDWAPCDFPKSA